MARQISTRRGGATSGDTNLLCLYRIIGNPLLYVVAMLATGASFYYLSQDPYVDVVAVPVQNNKAPAASLRSNNAVSTEGGANQFVKIDRDGAASKISAPVEREQKTNAPAEEVNQPKQPNEDPTLIKLNQTYLTHLKSLPPLPKKVHILFPDKHYDVTHASLPFVQHSIIALKTLNPNWNIIIHDNDDVDSIIRRGGQEGIISQQEVDILVGTSTNGTEAAHIVERSDIARLLLMYLEGGFYLDADRLISIPMDNVVRDSTRLCLPTFDDANFCQDLQCTSPKNELFLNMIRDCSKIRMTSGPNGGPLERRKGWSKGGALFDMGPVVYNRNILSMVFEGVTYDDIGSHGGYGKARESLVNSEGLILTKRDKSMDGLLVDGSIQHYDRGALYSAYGMKPWAAAVDAVWDEKR
ncbi:hypothetical protein ACHAXN_005596 [Cyclotella atomus]